MNLIARIIALCYLRLSNRGKHEVSIDMQRTRCQTECERLGLTPVFFEEGLGKHSANTRTKLPAWDKLLARALSDPTVYCVMAYDHERAFRNVTAARVTADQLSKIGVALVFTVSGEVDTKTASGKMMYTIHAAFSEHYSNYVSEKLIDHFETLRAKGLYLGHRAPFGLKRIGKAPDISFEPTPQLEIIRAWFDLYTAQDIGIINGAAILTERGLRWLDRKGTPRHISPDDLYNTLEALDYYKPFLPAALYRAVKRRRQERAQHKANGAQTVNPPLLLRGLLFCELCDKPYVCTHQLDRYGHLHGFYRHRAPILCGNIVKPSAQQIAERTWERVKQIQWTDERKAEMVQALTIVPDTSQVLDTKLMREKLYRRLDGYKQMLADGDIPRGEFLNHKAKIQQEIDALPQPTPEVSDPLTEAEAWQMVNNFAESLADPTLGTPYAKNRVMRDLFQRVTIQGKRGAWNLQYTPRTLFAEAFEIRS